MAINKPAKPADKAANQQPRADGWLNVSVVDAQGNKHRISRGIPLDASTRIGRSLLNAAAKALEEDSELVLTLEGSVYISNEDSQEDIPFL